MNKIFSRERDPAGLGVGGLALRCGGSALVALDLVGHGIGKTRDKVSEPNSERTVKAASTCEPSNPALEAAIRSNNSKQLSECEKYTKTALSMQHWMYVLVRT